MIDAPVSAVDAPNVDVPVDVPSPPAWTSGGISIVQGQPANYHRALAVFASVPVLGTTNGSNGPCIAYQDLPDSGLSAGTLAVAGTTAALSLVPSGTPPLVHYDPQPSPSFPLFAAGATITVTAPTFTIDTTAPADLAGFVPPTTAISRAAGYIATWTAGAGPLLEVVLQAGVGQLVCTVPDTGSYTVDPASLALLPAAATSVEVYVARGAHASLATPNVTLDVVSLIAAAQPVAFDP